MVFSLLEVAKEIVKNHLDSYPELKGHYERTGNIPAIKKWIETRPEPKY